jgi:hypothetical protein
MSRAKMVDYYLNRIQAGELEIIQVRQELESHNVPEEEIRIIVRLVDNGVQRQLKVNQNNSAQASLLWAGTVLTGAALLVMAGTYTGIIPMGRYFLLPYGAVLSGVSMVITGLAKRRR